ncbi:glycoside hydrolase superfamily [Kockovaella imperatae]|uniref:alpha-amylase n=1 Tax=Kockovaella imperatae TaxID=4999 RepID=A0A1Y1UFL4_9TREE|nr:glycoside hydrolase superfamily [Kockovaella imperatae]ORX36860.1 glycoside hydrolase superfamily [Kockovaella imperatae]
MKLSTPSALVSAALLACVPSTLALTAEQWKGKSIYQLLTDRFAPPSADAPARTQDLPAVCDPKAQTWCGGTWLSIIDKLDYIQDMGFDAIWISPVSTNIDIATPYNFAYHGYWVTNPTTLNPRFGSEQDLHTLSNELHKRNMLLMVDIVVNNVPSLSINDSLSTEALQAADVFWTNPDQYHPYCPVNFSNLTSEQYCWLGDLKLPLMDVDTENPFVITTLQNWIKNLTSTYNIDGLRIDAAKHIPGVFWPGFCGAAGVFCIGEVYTGDVVFAAEWQTQKWMDSILGYPLYFSLVQAFGTPMGNMSNFVQIGNAVLDMPDPMVFGNFLENHDLPRWLNATVDPQLAYNALIAQFIFDGIPIVYYGQEQEFHEGAGDPYNRQALWPSNYANTTTYNRIKTLNAVRKAVMTNNTMYNGQNFINSKTQFIASTDYDVAIRKGPFVAVLTNRGSPSQQVTFGVPNSGFDSTSAVIDIMSCRSFSVGANGTISVSYAASGYGGMPYLFMSQADVSSINWCGLGSQYAFKSPNATSSAVVMNPSMGLLGAGVLVLVAAGTLGSWIA